MRKNFLRGGRYGETITVYCDGWDLFELRPEVANGFIKTGKISILYFSIASGPYKITDVKSVLPNITSEAIEELYRTGLRGVSVELLYLS